MQAGQPITFNGTTANRKIVDLETITSSNPLTITASKLTVSGDVDIQGVLNTVTGTETVFEDTILVLNKNSAGSVADSSAALVSGIEVNRSSGMEASLKWDDGVDLWKLRSTYGLEVIGNGGNVGITTNDGAGNANITFNHTKLTSDQAGNAGRITVNVDDTTTAYMDFQVAENLAANQVTGIASVFSLTPNLINAKQPIMEQGKLLENKYLGLSGGTMTGVLNMGSQKITSLATPTAATDAATMGYVDSQIGGVDLSTCAIKSETNTFTANQTISGHLSVSGKFKHSLPTDLWYAGDHISIDDLGRLYTPGSFRVSLTSNGYRDNNNLWQRDIAAGVNGKVGAAQISLDPMGHILFETERVKNVGDTSVIPNRMIIDRDGNIGMGTTSPSERLEVDGNIKATNMLIDQNLQVDNHLICSVADNKPGANPKVRLGRDASMQYMTFHGHSSGNFMSSISSSGNPKPIMNFGISTDSGATLASTYTLRGKSGNILHTGNLPITVAPDGEDTVYTFGSL